MIIYFFEILLIFIIFILFLYIKVLFIHILMNNINKLSFILDHIVFLNFHFISEDLLMLLIKFLVFYFHLIELIVEL